MTIESSEEKLPIIAHSLESWLQITMSWVYNQLKYGQGYSSIVLANSTQNLELFPVNKLYSVSGKYKLFMYRVLRKAGLVKFHPAHAKAILMNMPVILHSHFGDIGWRDMAIVKKYGLKHIVTFYGYDVNMLPIQFPVWRIRYLEMFKKVDLVLCEGPHMAQCIVNLGCPSEKVRVQRLGVELDQIPFLPREIDDSGLVNILICGSFREKKGITYALEAIAKFRKLYPNIKVTIIGDASNAIAEQQEKNRILEVIERNDLKSIVSMLGYQPHHVLLEEAYKHHIFLSPSVTALNGDTEGGVPVTITEVVASGMPVVSTTHCDIPDVIHDRVSGLLTAERDVDGLVERLCWLVKNQDEWPRMLEAGRKHVEAEFSATTQGQKLSEIYAEIIRGKQQ